MQAYIDFEIAEGEFERTRALYERLLDRTKHLKVWISYAKFEASAMEENVEQKKQCIEHARSMLSHLPHVVFELFSLGETSICYSL